MRTPFPVWAIAVIVVGVLVVAAVVVIIVVLVCFCFYCRRKNRKTFGKNSQSLAPRLHYYTALIPYRMCL